MQNLNVDNEFKNLLTPLTNEEFNNLEEKIKKEGFRDALIVWDNTIIDGHNRYEICKKNNIKFDVEEMKFENKQEAKAWIIKNQFGRRNLTNYQRSELALQLENIYKKKAKENLSKVGGDKKSKKAKSGLLNSTKAVEPIHTREELAKEAGISGDTIYRSKIINENADDEIKDKVRSDEWSVNKGYQTTKILMEGREDLVEKIKSGQISHTEAYDLVFKKDGKEKENKDKGDDKTEEKDDNKMENLAVEENGGVNENEIKDVKQNNNPNTKTCNLCGYEKPLSDFSPGKYTCKKCRTDKRQYGTVATKEEDKQIREFLSEDKEVEFECEYSNEIITQIKEHVNNFLDNIKPITFLKTDISNMNENEKEEMKKVLNKLETKINSLKKYLGRKN
jgi:hypothetical protein